MYNLTISSTLLTSMVLKTGLDCVYHICTQLFFFLLIIIRVVLHWVTNKNYLGH